MSWFSNMVEFAREQSRLKAFSQGYEFAAAHLIRTNGMSDPRDFIPLRSNSSYDRGINSAVEDFVKILQCETCNSSMKSARIKCLTSG